MAIGAHDQKVVGRLLHKLAQRRLGLAGQDLRPRLEPRRRAARGRPPAPSAPFARAAHRRHGHRKPLVEGRARDMVDRAHRRGAAVIGDKHPGRPGGTPARPRGSPVAGPHDPFEVRAQMPLGEVRRLAPLADEDHLGPGLLLGHGIDDVAVPQACRDLGDAGAVRMARASSRIARPRCETSLARCASSSASSCRSAVRAPSAIEPDRSAFSARPRGGPGRAGSRPPSRCVAAAQAACSQTLAE
jgi:hypothetical protein